MSDRAMTLFELIKMQAEAEAMADELADMAEADMRIYEAAELEARQRGLPFDVRIPNEVTTRTFLPNRVDDALHEVNPLFAARLLLARPYTSRCRRGPSRIQVG